MRSKTFNWRISLPQMLLLCFVLAGAAIADNHPSGERDPWLRPEAAPAPEDNLPNAARIKLGEMLFWDPRLSRKGSMSCASCHNPALGWSDGLPTAVGFDMQKLGRATPTILNTAFNTIQMWDGRKSTLEDQALNLKITVPALTRIDADSASAVSATGITSDKVEINAGSAASVSIDGLVTKAAAISASSAATITLSGSCEVAEVVLSSAGTIHGPAFECVDLDVTASSSARGVLYASGQVNGVASSAAYVELYGDPDHVDDEISSGADIDVH